MSSEENTKIIRKIFNNDEYKQKWILIRDFYAPQLNRRPMRSEEAFTDHSYECHCINIYRNIDTLLVSNLDEQLTVDECFLLALAVILHDYIMSKDVREAARLQHSFKAFDYFKNKIKKQSDSFLSNKLKDNELNALAYIILGHSDIKSEPIIETIKEIPEKDTIKGQSSNKFLRLRLLASILRIADELDITSDRICERRTEETDINKSSEKHHRKLELISSITTDATTIIANICDDEIKDDEENDISLLSEIYQKINEELDKLNKLVFDKHNDFSWRYKNFEYSSEKGYAEKVKLIANNTEPFSRHAYLEEPKDILGRNDSPQKEGYSVHKKLNEELLEFVKKNNLIKEGHFRVDDQKEKVRDWIDIHKILADRKLSKDIAQAFADECQRMDTNNSKTIFVGIDFPGMLISSYLAYMLSMPFTYTISNKFAEHHDKNDRTINLDNFDNIIVVTDVIINFDSIENTMKALKDITRHNHRIMKIFSIFYRKRSDSAKPRLYDKYAKLSFFLNDGFEATICSKERDRCYFYMKNNERIYDNMPY